MTREEIEGAMDRFKEKGGKITILPPERESNLTALKELLGLGSNDSVKTEASKPKGKIYDEFS